MGSPKLVLRIPQVHIRVHLIRVVERDTQLQAIDLCEVFRHPSINEGRPLDPESWREVKGRVGSLHRLVVLAKGAHGSRVLDHGVTEIGLQVGLDFDRRPVNVLPLTEHMTGVVGGGGSLIDVEAVSHRVGLAFAGLAHAPKIDSPLEILRQLPFDAGVELLDANGVVLTDVQIVRDHFVRGAWRAAVDVEARQRNMIQSVEESFVFESRRQARTIEIGPRDVGVVIQSRQGEIQRSPDDRSRRRPSPRKVTRRDLGTRPP